MAIDAVERLERERIGTDPRDFQNPYDEEFEGEILLDGSDDDSGLEPHRR